ncbi:anti-sigma factor family protein [Cellulomonas algicola]|uniref:Anti-sigma factor n=1 Tax=Cellulomonas algicola TaxID=2071633 RepID=A0A401UVP3_9CELL|nr:zf-HC2 domain-containing protein [Cellulomonas algicola]GCD18670.1 anti-sigma factor [Cellulomonas algicola]
MTGRDSADRPDLPADDPFREWDAAYVLGALGPSDRRRFEEHLAVCDACQDRVAELAGMPGLLRALPPEQAVALLAPEPSDLTEAEVVDLAAVARRARSARRRRRLATIATAAAVALVAAVGGAWVARTVAPAPVTAQAAHLALRPVGGVDVTANLTMQQKNWGTRLDWSCEYPAPPADYTLVYELVLVEGDGTATVVATWSSHSGQARGLGASSSIPADDIARVEIRLQGADDPLAAAMT